MDTAVSLACHSERSEESVSLAIYKTRTIGQLAEQHPIKSCRQLTGGATPYYRKFGTSKGFACNLGSAN
jgi:hypothetical protein